MPHATVFILGPSRGYLVKSEVLPHIRDSNQRWLTDMGANQCYDNINKDSEANQSDVPIISLSVQMISERVDAISRNLDIKECDECEAK